MAAHRERRGDEQRPRPPHGPRRALHARVEAHERREGDTAVAAHRAVARPPPLARLLYRKPRRRAEPAVEVVELTRRPRLVQRAVARVDDEVVGAAAAREEWLAAQPHRAQPLVQQRRVRRPTAAARVDRLWLVHAVLRRPARHPRAEGGHVEEIGLGGSIRSAAVAQRSL
eukprot:3540235-Prymnesium_polylepis.1